MNDTQNKSIMRQFTDIYGVIKHSKGECHFDNSFLNDCKIDVPGWEIIYKFGKFPLPRWIDPAYLVPEMNASFHEKNQVPMPHIRE